jgi:hypothetical protein
MSSYENESGYLPPEKPLDPEVVSDIPEHYTPSSSIEKLREIVMKRLGENNG